MLTDVTQRWRDHRSSYRPAGEPIQTRLYEVVPMAKKGGPAADFVLAHHYAHSLPAARRQFGLYRGAQLVGAALFGVPANADALAAIPVDRSQRLKLCLDLGRFVLLDNVPANGETWFLRRCFEMLALEGFAGVVSFADPVKRTRLDGTEVMPGHAGTVYRGHNAIFTGYSKARIHQLLPDGTIFSPRALQKARAGECGRKYAVEMLTKFGAPEPGPYEPTDLWLKTWLSVIARPLRHRGCLRYAWGLHRAIKRQMGPGLPYPTWEELGLARPRVEMRA